MYPVSVRFFLLGMTLLMNRKRNSDLKRIIITAFAMTIFSNGVYLLKNSVFFTWILLNAPPAWEQVDS